MSWSPVSYLDMISPLVQATQMSLHHLGPDQPLCLPGPQFPGLMGAAAHLEADVCPSWNIQPLSGVLLF